ncbi:MAG: hypothetical protein FJ184_00060 [Gammaproteobacteria bacterium]|nr:hypothetical protein [Gammaproteobacteria bacterium]
MLGPLLQVIKMPKSNTANNLAKKIFSKSEVQNQIAVNVVKMIVGDIVTLYEEFRSAEGLGALFFNPIAPENSSYMTIKDIKNDIILAEEIMDEDLKDFLKKLLNIVDKEQDNKQAIVILINNQTMSIHLIDLNSVDTQIKELVDALSRD